MKKIIHRALVLLLKIEKGSSSGVLKGAFLVKDNDREGIKELMDTMYGKFKEEAIFIYNLDEDFQKGELLKIFALTEGGYQF